MARPEIAQLVQSGAQNALGLMQEKRMGDLFEMEKGKFQDERDAAEMINGVFAGEQEFSSKRGAGAQLLGELRKLTAMDPAVRKSQAPVVFSALEESSGKPLAENLKQFILSAKPEVAGPVMDKLLRGYAADPTQTMDELQKLLSNPLASAQAIGQISRDLGDVANQEALTGPVSNPRRNKFNEVKASRERMISGLEKVVAAKGHTKAGQIAQDKITQLRAELEKMETIISGQEAAQMGVRPGTTLTESGTGNVAVLQGPDDSGDGTGGAGGLKATDERLFLQFAAQEFGAEINMQTGVIKFKTLDDGRIGNEVIEKATRLFKDSDGKLTRAEAWGKAMRDAGRRPGGALPPGAQGSNPYDQFTPGG